MPSPGFLLALLAVSILTNVIFAVRVGTNLPSRVASIVGPAVPPIGPRDRVLGDPAKGIPVIVYSDLACPYSARLQESLRAVGQEVGIAVAYRHFPLRSHPLAARAAEAAECAGDQGLFFDYVDLLFALEGDLTEERLREAAAGLGLDPAAFAACLDGGVHRSRVAAQSGEASRLHLGGTPTLFIAGKRYDAMLPYPVLRRELLDAGAPMGSDRCREGDE